MKIEYPYIILDDSENFVDEDGNPCEDGGESQTAFSNELSAIKEIERFCGRDGLKKVYYVAKLTLTKRVSPPSGCVVEDVS